MFWFVLICFSLFCDPMSTFRLPMLQNRWLMLQYQQLVLHHSLFCYQHPPHCFCCLEKCGTMQLFRFQQAVGGGYQRAAAPLGDKEILPLRTAEVRMLYCRKSPESNSPHSTARAMIRFTSLKIRIVKAVRQFVVKLITGRDSNIFSGIDVRQRFYQCGKS